MLAGRRAGCHTICWMAPFMIIGRKLRNLVAWPSLRLTAQSCLVQGLPEVHVQLPHEPGRPRHGAARADGAQRVHPVRHVRGQLLAGRDPVFVQRRKIVEERMKAIVVYESHWGNTAAHRPCDRRRHRAGGAGAFDR